MAENNLHALSFDGADDYTSTVLLPAEIRCLEFWVEIDSDFITGDEAPIGLFQFESYLHALHLGKSGFSTVTATMRLRMYDGRSHRSWYTLDPITKGAHHIAVNFDSQTDINFIIDGQAATMVQATSGAGYRAGLAINGELYNERPKGVIDEVRAWATPRTQEQIQDNMYKSLVGNEAGLILYWRLDDGAGSSLVDSSPNANHGTITGATWVPGLVDLDVTAPPGRVDISATLRGSASMSVGRVDRIKGISATLQGAATATGGEPIRIRGLSANLTGAATVSARMNLIAALKAHLQGQATLKANMLVLFVPEGVFVIDGDEIFSKNQPSRGAVVANHIEVWVNPLKPTEEAEEVYRSKDPVTIPATTTQAITIHFDDEPVTEPAVTLAEAGANLSIVDTRHYAWGAVVSIQNTGATEQSCLIVANGKPLKVQGREKVIKRDPVSIQEVGPKKYEFDNPFVQDRATAELIADKLLSFANTKRDIEIEWRGNPALELADVTMIPEYQRRGLDQRGIFYITKQELEFDGGLKAKLEGRKM